jgi:hypothetical protein
MESSDCTVLEQVFRESFPDEWGIKVLQALDYAYKETNEYVRSPRFGSSEARDTRSHNVRGIFENQLRIISNQYPGISAESRFNKKKSYFHTWVKSGSLYLTASSVHKPSDKPRPGVFRDIYLNQSNGQLELFETRENLRENDYIYALLLYGPSQAYIPSFVRVAFPCRNWSKKYIESIDLLKKYPGIIHQVAPIEEMQEPSIEKLPEETIPQPQKPGIRRLPKQAGGQRE